MNIREYCKYLHAATGLTLVFLFVLCRPATAQTISRQQISQLADLTRQGRYDELIDQITDLLNAAGQPNATLLYLRGRAEWQLSWFGAAAADLTPLGDFAPWPKWEPASEFVQKIEQMRDVFRLLDLFKQTHDFDNSFQDAFNISPDKFYAAWFQETKRAAARASLNAP